MSYNLLILSVRSLSLYKVQYMINSGFEFQNGFATVAGTVYQTEMFQNAKKSGGLPLSAHIKHCSINRDNEIFHYFNTPTLYDMNLF